MFSLVTVCSKCLQFSDVSKSIQLIVNIVSHTDGIHFYDLWGDSLLSLSLSLSIGNISFIIFPFKKKNTHIH